ncbi:MAG: ABC transporter substrate-binding protein [Promethearchaeota archaeon]
MISYLGGRKREVIFAIGLVLLLNSLGFYNGQSVNLSRSWSYPSGFDPHGSYIDQLHWEVYSPDYSYPALIALTEGELDGYDGILPYDSVAELLTYPGIEVTEAPSLTYYQLVFNTKRFPTNISAYRRALAYAFDKHWVTWPSLSNGLPMDGAIPIGNLRYCCESLFAEHYYAKDIAKANATLEEAGFRDLDGDGWREYDSNNNSLWDPSIDIDDRALAIEIVTDYWLGLSIGPSYDSPLILMYCMEEAGLRGIMVEAGWVYFLNGLMTGDFWCTCLCKYSTLPDEPDFLYDNFYSQSQTNLWSYRYNSSEFDYNVTRMLHASTEEEIRGWVWNCSQLLLKDMPMISCYTHQDFNTYQGSKWEGYVPMEGVNCMGINPWTHRKLRLTPEHGGPFGYTYPVIYREALTGDISATNVLQVSDYAWRSRTTEEVFMNLYSRLWQIDPYTWDKVPDLAYNWTLEPTIAAGDIQDGMKYTFHLYENVTWHDGTPFTAEDVAFSIGTIWSTNPTNVWSNYTFWQYTPSVGDSIRHIYRIDTPGNYTIEMYSNSTGYIDFTRSTYPYILPKHVWEHHSNFAEWSPSTPDELVGTGPFQWIEYVPDQYILLHRYDKYHFGISVPLRPPTGYQVLIMYGILLTIGVIIISLQVIVLGYLIRRHKRKTKDEAKTKDNIK